MVNGEQRTNGEHHRTVRERRAALNVGTSRRTQRIQRRKGQPRHASGKHARNTKRKQPTSHTTHASSRRAGAVGRGHKRHCAQQQYGTHARAVRCTLQRPARPEHEYRRSAPRRASCVHGVSPLATRNTHTTTHRANRPCWFPIAMDPRAPSSRVMLPQSLAHTLVTALGSPSALLREPVPAVLPLPRVACVQCSLGLPVEFLGPLGRLHVLLVANPPTRSHPRR